MGSLPLIPDEKMHGLLVAAQEASDLYCQIGG